MSRRLSFFGLFAVTGSLANAPPAASPSSSPRASQPLWQLPPLGTVVSVSLAADPSAVALRHCSFSASFMPAELGDDDFRFTLVAALNGAPLPAVSLRSTNFPTM